MCNEKVYRVSISPKGTIWERKANPDPRVEAEQKLMAQVMADILKTTLGYPPQTELYEELRRLRHPE